MADVEAACDVSDSFVTGFPSDRKWHFDLNYTIVRESVRFMNPEISIRIVLSMKGNRCVGSRSTIEKHLPAARRTHVDSKISFPTGKDASSEGFDCFERYIEVFIVAGWSDFPSPIEVPRVGRDILRVRDDGVVRQRGAFRITVVVYVRISLGSSVDVERIQPHSFDNTIELHGLRHLRYVIDMPA